MSKFQVGDIVIVNNKTLMSYGCICRVIEPEYRNPLNSHLVYVSIVSMGENTRLKELPYHAACMQFKEGNLKHYNYENETEVTPMNTINSNEKFTLVKIRFLEGSNRDREYCYASYEESIGCGDFVVCKSANHGFGIAEVTEIVTTNHYSENELESMRNFALAGREIVSRFNMSRYEKRVMDRERIRKCNTERKKLLKEMKTILMEDEQLALFARVAETNPKMAKLLKTYNNYGETLTDAVNGMRATDDNN